MALTSLRVASAHVASFSVAIAVFAAPEPAHPAPHAARFTSYAVAADHPLASAAGAEMLAAGGNAVDAAVASAFALGVVRPFSCGIGGGGFMVVHLKEDAKARRGKPLSVAINFRETTPAAVGPNFYEKLPEGASTVGGKAVAVPGEVAGLLHALEKHGTMKREQVLAPAIRLAREGFVVDEAYARAAASLIAKFKASPDHTTRFAFVWSRFLKEGAVKVGDRITLPEQAEALELIARNGARGFSEGPVAEAIVEAVKADGGVLTLADLKRFKVEETPPLIWSFEGRTFLGMPLPSSGGLAMAQTLGILERRKITQISARGVGKGEAMPTEFVWAFIEASKHAFSDRARWLGDPKEAAGATARLLAPHYLDALAMSIMPGRAATPAACGSGWTTNEQGEVIPDDGGTSHVSVVDARGNAAAVTSTINLELGSLVAVPQYGFVLNNQMDDFTTRAGQRNAFGLLQSDKNRPGPGKRPLSSMSPTIVLDERGDVLAVAGASGGPRIISATTLVLLNAFVLKMPADRAVASPRVHHQWMPDEVRIEENARTLLSQGLDVESWLKKAHYRLTTMTGESAVQAIFRETDAGGRAVWHAASDPRKGGAPAGR
jgi:gamma-glutamyltranspeptidase/glutathione hydrolase